ncbi:integrase domain-containing protein [Pseudomonadota bacterium]
MMGKVGGNRNFGFGKRMDWAGKNALADRYGNGHYATRAAHTERWGRFVTYAKAEGIKDARDVTQELIAVYGRELADEVRSGDMAVAYAQNLLSSVNVVLEALRGDQQMRVSPAAVVGQRMNVRSTAPAGMERSQVSQAAKTLQNKGDERVAAVAELARDLGLRFREASLLDVRSALIEAKALGKINITEGTKGGRGREVDRWIPISQQALHSLEKGASIQEKERNLIPLEMRFDQWRDYANAAWRSASHDYDLAGFHNLRAAYACDRYQQLTGYAAPVISHHRMAEKTEDQVARQIISHELGHSRIEVVAAYVGSAK